MYRLIAHLWPIISCL